MRLFSSILLLAAATAHATDHGSTEGRFVNDTSRVLYCFKDVEGESPHLCVSALLPGRSCRGDAVSAQPEGAHVFKIPNDTTFRCANATETGFECVAGDPYSRLRTELASIYNGADRYGNMTWSHFTTLMNRQVFGACDPRWQEIEGVNPDSCDTSRDELAALLTQSAEAIAPVGGQVATMQRFTPGIPRVTPMR